jgi:chromosome segregation protein
MKIRRLEIQGFKSFSDRTTFEFGDGITAIVGPNGCGKSNVVDAVKWVLGDMSPKSLRGKRMEDVIFAGSSARKPVGLAEVTLVLDNADGILPTERTEVAVTRRLYRSGESEYLVNGDAGRLKDVRELFFDTGLGAEGHSIMEQGQIDALLRANSTDRRGIFEEAAGVSRYKQRKKEAEGKLERTAENLERLRDVLELEEKRLRSLKTQASRARRWRELVDELRRKRVLSAVVRWRAATAERAALEATIAEARAKEEAAALDLAAFEADAARREAERETVRGRIHELETAVATAAGDARAADDRVTWARRTIEDLRGRIAAAERAAADAAARAASLAPDADAADLEAGEAGERARGHEADLAVVEGELLGLEREAEERKAAHDGAKRETLEILQRSSKARNEETERRTEARQAEGRLARLREQRAEAEARLARVEGEAAELAALAVRMDADAASAAEALASAEDDRARHAEEVEAAERRRGAFSEERAKKTERLELLRRLAAAYEGVEGGAREVLAEAARRADRGGVLGLLADLIETTTAGAHVLDRLLGHAAGAVVVRSTADALAWLEWLRGRGHAKARFLSLDLVREAAAPLPPEAGVVRGDPEVLRLVASAAAGCLLVPDLRAGIGAWRSSAAGVNAVTPAGDRITASGAVVGGAGAAALGLVERAAEMRRLTEEVRTLSAEVDAAAGAADRAREAVRDAEEAIRRRRQDIARRSEDRGRHGAALARIEKERGHLASLAAAAGAEASEQEAARAEAEAGAAAAAGVAAGLERRRLEVEALAEEALTAFEALETRTKTVGERRMEVRLAIADARARADAASARAERVRRDVAALLERSEAARAEAGALAARVGATEVEVAEAESVRRSRESDRRRDADRLVEARGAHESLDRDLAGARGRTSEVAELHERLRRELDEFRLREGEHRVRIEALVEQVREEHGVDLAVASAEAEAQVPDAPALEAEIADLRAKVEELGNVNMNAIAEMEEADQRVSFLRAQEKDLLDAKAQLEGAITQLDELSVTRFRETFEAVKSHFNETFRRLFGGGRADVVLENPQDLLESGIDIIARPPGKEPRTISQLSGGERTLTAVALLFAVFRARPSPFAILDEVDAALDEANIRRLVALVTEFTAGSQFLVVTHSKTTMEAANVLYGVTMEEPGVSKKVAVRLADDAPAPLEAAAAAG